LISHPVEFTLLGMLSLMNKIFLSNLHLNAGPLVRSEIALHPTLFQTHNIGSQLTAGTLANLPSAADHVLPSCSA
jgi:hypothetical protein